jgi:predicted chitinase
MASNEPKVEDKGFLLLADPNPPGRDLPPIEDLFIYVKLNAYTRSRSVIVNDSGKGPSIESDDDPNGTQVNFIATKINYNGDGSVADNGVSYATTDYTEIGGLSLDDKNYGGVVEGFGIKSINITYNSSLVPQVDITFTDLRGASLFDIIDGDNRKSPYSLFFKMPYPVFNLTVKGYYGKPVTYCLHMLKWSSQFNSDSGNFDITAKFVGFQSAFLSDIRMQQVIGVVNTEEGKNRLSGTSITNDAKTFPTPSISDFLNDISKIQVDVENIKDDIPEVKELKELNTTLSIIDSILSYIGSPVPFEQENENQLSKQKKSAVTYFTNGIKSPSLKVFNNMLSIRDIIVVSEGNNGFFDEYVKIGSGLFSEYKKYITSIGKENDYNFKGSLFPEIKDKKYPLLGSGGYKNLEIFINEMYNPESKPYEVGTNNSDFTFEGSGEFPNPEKLLEFLEKKPSNKFKKGSKVTVYDFSKTRDSVLEVKRKLEKERDKIQKDVITSINKKISDSINFNPTIRNTFEVIMNNTQVMLESIYDVSKKAEENIKERYYSLGSKTDNTGDVVYPWPTVYEDDGKGEKQVWLGSVSGVDESLFPEIKFVEDVIDGYLKTSKELLQNRKLVAQVNQGGVVDNWLPINIMDYNSNPYTDFNGNSLWEKQTNDIPNEFYNRLLKRVITLSSYSNLDDFKIKEFASIDGAVAATNITTPNYTVTLKENLKTVNVIKYGIDNKVIISSDNKYSLSEDYREIDGFFNKKITGNVNVNDDNLYLVIGSKVKSILDNRNDLNSGIKTKYETKINNLKTKDQKKDGSGDISNGIFYQGKNSIYRHNISYLVWANTINKKLKPTNWKQDFVLSIEDIDTIDNTNFQNINVLRVLDKTEKTLIGSKLWNNNTSDKLRAFFMLNTLPYIPFEKVLQNYVTDDSSKEKKEKKVSKVIDIPKLYMVWVGSLLWRIKETPTINFDSDEIKIGSEEQYIKSLGGSWKESYPSEIKLNTLIPKNTQDHLIEYFEKWVDSSWDGFLDSVNKYKNTIENIRKDNSSNLLDFLDNVIQVGIPTPNALTGNNFDIEINKELLNSYIDNFIEGFGKMSLTDENGESNDSGNGVENDSKQKTLNDDSLKIAFYNNFKEIYDKWIGGTNDGRVFNVCGGNITKENGKPKDLIDYFKFINRAWSDIGDEAVCNLNSVVSLAGDTKLNLYLYISKVLRDSNFLLQILPSYINYKDITEVKDAFTPITNIDKRFNTGPTYVCILAGGQSKVLNIDQDKRYQYKDDGFSLFENGETPKEFNPTDVDLTDKLVAFRVAFGSENQSVFSKVDLNQEEHSPTGEYFKQLSELVDKRGGTQRVLKGNDLYDLFSTRSYKCKVGGLGNMNIQPLMYFQLDNVPFFKGSYLISSVEHSITPNHMETTFTGLRQSIYTVPVENDITTFLNVDLNEVDEIAQRLKVSNFLNQLNKTNYDFQILNPRSPFSENNLEVVNLDRLFTKGSGVGLTNINKEYLSTALKKWLPIFNVKTNSQVSNFLAQCSHESLNFNPNWVIEKWDGDPEPDENGVATNGSSAQLKYEGNSKLGNTVTGDGLRFKGRGFIQVTGRSNYKDLQNDTTSDGSTVKAGDLFKNITTEYNRANGWEDIDKLFDATTQEGVERCLVASLIWWKNSGVGTLPNGTVSEAQTVSRKVNPYEGDKKQNLRIQKLEKIVDTFNIKTDYIGGTENNT